VDTPIAQPIHLLQTMTAVTTESSLSTSFGSLGDLVSLVGAEALLLVLAAFAYLAATGGLPQRRAAPKQLKSKPEIPTRNCEHPAAVQLQAVSRAVREGNVERAVEQLLPHLQESFQIPVALGAKLLLLLARPQQLAATSGQASQLTGHFSSSSLESAAVEALRRGDVAACRQLRRVASALNIAKSPMVYELFAKTHSPNQEDLMSLIAEMESAEVVWSKSMVEALLTACATVKDSELAAEILAKVELPQSDKDLCAALIKVYASCEQWDMAVCLYEEVMIPANLKPDASLGDVLTKAATVLNRSDLLPALAESMSGDLGRQAKAIRAHGKEGNLQSAISVFESVKQAHPAPNSLVYNSLMEACVQCNELKTALNYFNEAKERKLANVVSYNTIMKGYLINGNCKAAQQLLVDMKESGLPASLVTYHGLLNAKVQSGDTREAWRLVDELRSVGLVPNAVTCSILLKAFVTPAQAHDLSRVIDLIESMESPMDEVLFASVAEACIRTGRLDVLSERTRLYSEKGGLQGLTAPTYGSMIKAYGQARDVEQVWVLWDEMSRRQVRPTSITLGCMVEALVMNDAADQAWQLVKKISEDEAHKGLLNTVIYSTILKGFAMSKRADRLMALYEEMRAKNIPCNTITYNTMLNAFAQCGDMHKVPKLLEDMKNATPPVEPDIVTYSTMVKGFCAAGDVDKGMQLLRDMEEDGKLAPDEVMFNSLLDGCARQHRLEDALQLLENMKQAGVAPSNYTLSIMVKLLGRARRLNQAFAMVKSVCDEHGFRANVQVYTCLIQACFHNRHTAKALALHDQIVTEGCPLDQKAYIALVRGCLQAGAVDKAAEVVRCAHHIKGHGMLQGPGRAPGVDARCWEEVLGKLGANSAAAQQLRDDVNAVGGPSREQRPHFGGAARREPNGGRRNDRRGAR
jgi:pentatricopeptide repeat protein